MTVFSPASWPGLRWRLGLRWTLLLALLPLLTLPWIGLRFVERMAELARDERLENQAAAARALAASLHERRELWDSIPGGPLPPGAQALPVDQALIADGHPDWSTVPWRDVPVHMNPGTPNNLFRVRLAAARNELKPERMYLLVEVDDDRYVPRRPPSPGFAGDAAGDELIVEAEADSGLLAPTAPQSEETETETRHQQAMWADAVRALQRVSGRVSVYDANGALRAQQGTLYAAPVEPEGWQAQLAQLLLSAAVRFQPDAMDPRDSPGGGGSLLSPLARALAGAPAQQSQRAGIQGGMPAWILTSAHPIWVRDNIVGALVLEENTAARLVLGQAALERLTLLAALAVAASVVALLLVASITVGRVVRLRNEAEGAIDQRGRVIRSIRSTALADELGDLRSSYARVLTRLREHQEYLANLRSRLVHELRTPIMVVRSSLENLSAEVEPAQQAAYIARVQAGASRLERIVASMGEASSLETMLADSGLEDVDLRKLLSACADGYRSAFAPRAFELRIDAEHASCSGVPEAIAQALDKLVSNAADFARPDTPIVLTLAPQKETEVPAESSRLPATSGWRWRPGRRRGSAGSDERPGSLGGNRKGSFWRISVANHGPSLPRNMGESLFDQMVSVRGERQSEQSHLGLGLYLVRLIAEFHGGEAYVRNLPDGVEAGFTLRSSGSFGPMLPALPPVEMDDGSTSPVSTDRNRA